MPILKANKEEIQGIWVLIAKAKKRVVVMNSWLEASKGTMVVSSWQKPIIGATLNQTGKGAMITSLWKESAKKLWPQSYIAGDKWEAIVLAMERSQSMLGK